MTKKDTTPTPLCSKMLLLFACIILGLTHAHASVKPADGTKDMAALYGNYLNAQTNEWTYGFFEDFAIYNNRFWDYKTVKASKNKTKIVLTEQNTQAELVLNVEKKKDGSIFIKKGKQKAEAHVLFNKKLPPYKQADNSEFPNPTYEQDSVTIIGYYRNYDKMTEKRPEQKKPFGIAVPNFIHDEDIEYFADIDEYGRFKLTFPIMNTQSTYADWGRLTEGLLFQPGDTLFVYADMLDIMPNESDASREAFWTRPKDVITMGRNARVNNECIQYGYLPLGEMRTYEANNKDISNPKFYAHVRKYHDEDTKKLLGYMSENMVSKKFKTYQEIDIRFDFLSSLMQRRFSLNSMEQERFEVEYINSVNDAIDLSDERAYTLVRNVKSFLRDYIGYADDATMTMVSFDETAEEMRRQNIMTPEYQRIYDEGNRMIKMLEDESLDSLQRVKVYGEFSQLMKQKPFANHREEMVHDLFARKELQSTIGLCDSLIANNNLRQLYLASAIYKVMDRNKKPLKPFALSMVDEKISLPGIKNYLMHTHDYYKKLEKAAMSHAQSLVNTSHLAEYDDAEKLFQELIAPYKGKVIYLDFWGTWCGPCRKNISLSGPLKKHFEGKDVIFMYLANRSPEETWKGFIKETGLTGDNIVHYRLPDGQQSMIERKFGVNSFPTYMIIDKEGNVVNAKAPAPIAAETAIKEIEKVLEK